MKLSTIKSIGKLTIAAAFTMLAMHGSSARADLYQYVLESGTSTISGSIGTTTFTNATWSLSNIVDPTAGTALSPTATLFASTSQFTVHSGGSTYVYNLGGTAGQSAKMITSTGNGGRFFATGVFDQVGDIYGGILFGLVNPDPSLVTPGTYTMMNVFDGPFVATTQGNIVITNAQVGLGSLTISQYGSSAVPEPAEWAGLAMLGTGLGGLVVRARRRKATA